MELYSRFPCDVFLSDILHTLFCDDSLKVRSKRKRHTTRRLDIDAIVDSNDTINIVTKIEYNLQSPPPPSSSAPPQL